MADPVVAQKAPFPIEVEAGKTYWWCTCGQSAKQPFCDGTHKGSEFTPRTFTPDTSETVYLCGCKFTHNAPFCDGTHGSLAG